MFKPIFPVRVSDDVRRRVLETAELLRSLGHEVVERDPAYPRAAIAGTFVLFTHALATEIARLPAPERLERRIRAQGRTGRLIPETLARRALAARPSITERALTLFDDCDVLITPVLAKPPIEVGHWEGLGPNRGLARTLAFMPFTPAQNYTAGALAAGGIRGRRHAPRGPPRRAARRRRDGDLAGRAARVRTALGARASASPLSGRLAP